MSHANARLTVHGRLLLVQRVALVGALVTSRLGPAGRGNVASATHTSWWLLTACGLGVLLLGATATTRRAEASARRTAAQLNPQALSA